MMKKHNMILKVWLRGFKKSIVAYPTFSIQRVRPALRRYL